MWETLSVLRGSLLGGGVSAGSFMHPGSALVFLPKLFDEASIHEILQLFIGTQTEHFLPAADRVSQFQVLKNSFEQIVEPEHLLFRKDAAKFIGHMVW